MRRSFLAWLLAACSHTPPSRSAFGPPPSPAMKEEVRANMRASISPVVDCFARYMLRGRAEVHVRVAADGSPFLLEILGEFAGTPTGDCIADALRGHLHFSASNQPWEFHYPFILAE